MLHRILFVYNVLTEQRLRDKENLNLRGSLPSKWGATHFHLVTMSSTDFENHQRFRQGDK